MDKCRYHINIDGVKTTFYSDKELTEFVKNNIEKDADSLAIKHSKESGELQSSQELSFNTLSKVDAWNPTFDTPNSFIKKEHIINGEKRLLSPFFDDKNFIREQVRLLKINNSDLSDEELTEKVTKELESEQEMVHISELNSNIIKLILGKSFNKEKLSELTIDLIKSVNRYNKEEVLYDENIHKDLKEEIETKFLNAVSKYKIYSELGIVNQRVTSNDVNLNGLIDYLSIDQEGTPHITEIKTSKLQINKWDQVKVLSNNYILGIKRQLLSNYLFTENSRLNLFNVVIPESISQSGKLNLYSLNFEHTDQSLSTGPLAYSTGTISSNLRSLLPARFIRDEATVGKMSKQIQDTLNAMFPKYSFRTKRLVDDIDKIVNDAIKRANGNPKVYISNRLDVLSPRIEEDTTIPGWEERFRKKVEEYMQRWNSSKDSWMNDLIKSINSSKGRRETKLNLGKNYEKNIDLDRIINKYLNPEWVLLNNTNIPELAETGILLFRNNLSNVVEAISITINDLNQLNDLGRGNTLLGKFKKNEHLQNDNKVLKATTSNIETIKALVVINSLGKELKDIELNNIMVYNPWSDKGDFVSLKRAVYNFDLLIDEVSKLMPSMDKNKIKVSDTWKTIYTELMDKTKTNIDNNLRNDIESFKLNDETMKSANDKLQWFIKFRDKMLENYPSLTKVDQTKVPDFTNPENYVYYLVSLGVSYYSGLNDVFDYDVPRYGFSWADALHIIKTVIFTGKSEEVDPNGKKIVGFMQGSHFNTTDSLPSEAWNRLHGLITIASNSITSMFSKEQALITKATDKFYSDLGRSDLQKVLIGNADKYYEPLYEQYKGKVSQELKLQNPWDNKSNLNTSQREYLKTILFTFYKYGNPKYKIETLEEFEKHPSFNEIIKENHFFYIPLAKKVGLSKLGTKLTTNWFRQFIGKFQDDIRDQLDARNIMEEQRVASYEVINGFKRMYNQFEAQHDERHRDSLIEKYGSEFFEINLDTLALKYVFENIREKEFNRVLPNIHCALTVMKFHGWSTGKSEELNKALEDFYDQLKISVYGASIIDKEEGADVLASIKKVQKLASIMALALRPSLLVKEMVVGSIKNVSYAWSKVYGDDTFNEKTLTKAYKLVATPDSETYDLIDSLNMEYRFVNYDMNHIVDRKKVDRYGLEFFSNNLYWFNRAPDYINRMSLFLAKMLHDGSYQAHTLNKDGQLIYDPAKDKRYSYYFEKRKEYKFEYHKTDLEYNKQRNLYLTALEIYNTERAVLSREPLDEKTDKLPQAYTSKEKDSIKNFSDMAYGFYDHERTPLEKNTAKGILFGQFLTYWPSKLRYYFGLPDQKSPRGFMSQKYIIDEKGDKIYLWEKREYDDEGNLYVSHVTEDKLAKEDPKIPANTWNGMPSEGLAYSLGLTIRDLITKGSLEDVNPDRLNKAKLALHDLLVAMLMIILSHAMYSKNEDGKIPYKEMGEFEKLAMNTMIKSFGEFDPISSGFGALSWTPAFVSIMGNTYADFKSLVSGKSDLENFLRQNFRSLELLPSNGSVKY